MSHQITILLFLFLFCHLALSAQDSSALNALQSSSKYYKAVDDKTSSFIKQIKKSSELSINKLIKQETKMQNKIAKVDSLVSKNLFQYSLDSLKKLQNSFGINSTKLNKYLKGNYIPYLDTLKNSLLFLSKIKSLSQEAKTIQTQAEQSMQMLSLAESNLSKLETLQEYISQRQQVLQTLVGKYPQIKGNVQKLSKEAYYYSEQISKYKSTFKDPSQIEKEVMNRVRNLPAFQNLIQSNSQLSAIFTSPASFGSLISSPSMPIVNGLPNRAMLQQHMQQALPLATNANPFEAIQQQISDVNSQADRLKNKINSEGGMDNKSMPTYTPNSQHTKSFKNRLEFGTDFHFDKAVNFIPATGAIGLTLGYKLNDKSIIGVGGNYLLGLGQGWNHIHLSSDGIGFRTFLKWKINKTLDIQGGSEWNYISAFKTIQELKSINSWQQSILVGISKNYNLGKKIKGNIQILYDALYNRHLPNSQPVVFRFGYSR